MKNTQHIKRYPMCGGKASIYQDYYGYLIQCNQCGVSTLHRKELSRALMEWNRRVKYE